MTPKHEKAGKRTPVVLWITLLTVCVTLAFAVVTLVRPHREFSDSENRKLAVFPAFTFGGLFDGSFAAGIDTWLADQFAGRDRLVEMDHTLHRLEGQRDSGGVYLGDKDTLMLIPSAPNEAAVAANQAAINGFAARYPDLHHAAMIVPNAVCTLADRLPPGAPVPDQRAQLSAWAAGLQGVDFADVTDALSGQATPDVYYRTDHHWTTYGASTALKAAAETLRIDYADCDFLTVSDSFEGTLAAKSGVHAVKDTIQIPVLKETDLQITLTDDDGTRATLYAPEKLDTHDQYAVFLGGNKPLAVVRSTVNTGRRLLLFKDSYANCLVPFLTAAFEEIVLVDPRYYVECAEVLIPQHGITDVWYVYNLDTFMTDTSLADALAPEDIPD